MHEYYACYNFESYELAVLSTTSIVIQWHFNFFEAFWQLYTKLGEGTVGSCVTLCQNVSVFPIPHCGCVCRISTLIMVPINFCDILTCLKPKEHNFVAQRLIELERSKENLWKCLKKISQVQTINLWNIFGAMMSSIKLDNFGYSWQRNDLLGSKCHIPMLQSPV